jgi:hypothetical protein
MKSDDHCYYLSCGTGAVATGAHSSDGSYDIR